jgi:NADH:ubiquinone oxidoreductase subunit 3 (subunit A)
MADFGKNFTKSAGCVPRRFIRLFASPWTIVLIYFIIALVVAFAVAIVPGIFTQKRPTRKKLEPYECGVPPTSLLGGRMPVHFYLVAMLFVVFDVEAASFYPRPVKLKQLGAFGLLEMVTFIVVLGIGYAYVWKKGGFSWK